MQTRTEVKLQADSSMKRVGHRESSYDTTQQEVKP